MELGRVSVSRRRERAVLSRLDSILDQAKEQCARAEAGERDPNAAIISICANTEQRLRELRTDFQSTSSVIAKSKSVRFQQSHQSRTIVGGSAVLVGSTVPAPCLKTMALWNVE